MPNPIINRRVVLGGGGVIAPAPPLSGLIARWESDNITGLNDGDPISTWPDTSGLGRDATQATASLKPLFKTNIFGTKPAVRFDGSNDKLTFTTTSIPSWTMFTVMTVRTYKAFAGTITWRAAGEAGFVFWDTIGNAAAWVPSIIRTNTSNAEVLSNYKNVNGYIFVAPYPSGPGIFMMRYNDGSTTLDCRRDALAYAGTTAGGFTGVSTEGSLGIGFDYLNADVGAFLVYDTNLSDANADLAFNYLNTKYIVY